MVFWEIAGHSIALTGDGLYDDYPPDWAAFRCLGCPGQRVGDADHPLWRAEEVHPDNVRWDSEAILAAVVRHLRDGGDVVPGDVVASARALAALSGQFDEGLHLIQDHFGGGERQDR
ncbi:hypothetical protein [Nocardioides sp. GCM10030258]|uniref:hypothetical protein n=1 Tax=unclassified Nocardioides TaxID=2615069 RepID=UPI003623A99F